VTIPNSVTSVGERAFEGSSINRLIVESETPIPLSSHIHSMELEVPVGSIEMYIHADYWKDIPAIYARSNGKKYVCVQFEEEGGSVAELVGYSGGIIEVDASETMELKAKNDLYKYCVLFKGNKDVSEVFQEKGRFTFQPSTTSYKENFIKIYSYPTTVVNVSTAGTLGELVGIENVESIASLKVSGNLNGTDIFVIRKMTNLKLLDMTDATIFNGGQSYYEQYTTSLFAIGDYFFKDKIKLEIVLLPKNTKEIRSHTFDGCRNLYAITIPHSVSSIGNDVFWGCDNLTSVTFLCSSVSPWFAGMSSIKEVVLGNQVTSIGDGAFSGCSGLKSITIPNSVSSIGCIAFEGCSGLTSVTIGNSVTSIDAGAFSDCSGLTSITIPSSVREMWAAFNGCNNLTSVTVLCPTVPYFGGLESLTEVVLGNLVSRIGDGAFSGCSGLKSITIPNSVSSIGDGAFSGCSGLKSITIPNSVSSIGGGAFSGCSGLKSITIPNSVSSIGGSAFEGCSGLTSVTIPNSVTSIERETFCHCRSLTSMTIPNSVTSIGNSAFRGCRSLTSVTIPNSVTSIGDGAFSDCSGLKSITIPNSVTSIERSAFWGCGGLTSVTIPNSVTSIGYRAFSDCISLKSVYSLNSTPPEMVESSFDETTYNQATLYVPTGCRTIYWLHPYWENFFEIKETDTSSSVEAPISDVKYDGDIYNLNGTKVDGSSFGKGIYIKNGKKVIIK